MADDRRRGGWRAKDWRGAGGAAGPEPGKRRPGAGKRFVLLAGILALIGVIAGIAAFLREPPRPMYLGLAVTEYGHRSLPVNPWAQQDSDGLRPRFPDDGIQAFEGQEKAKFTAALEGLVERTRRGTDEKRPVVVHITMLGVANDRKVYLLPGLAEPDSPPSWVKLDDVLASLRNGKGSCLLLLDIARPSADARLGRLSDDAAAALDDELTRLEKAGDLKLLVLTACDRGQTSHTSVELKRSVFGYFADAGLAGAADGWGDGRANDQVTAKELAAYVRAQVAHWANFYQLPAQTPKLYGAGGDFVLRPTDRAKPELAVPEVQPPFDAYPKWLAEAWAERDDWRKNRLEGVAPRAFRLLEAAAVRAERQWLGGVSEDVAKRDLGAELARVRRLRPELPDARRPVYSLAVAQRRGIKDEEGDASAAARLATLFAAMEGATPPKDPEMDAALKAFAKMPPEPLPKEAIALAALTALARIPDPTRDQLRAFDQFLTRVIPAGAAQRPAEFFALRLLANLDNRPNTERTQFELLRAANLAAALRRIVRSGVAAEQAAAIDARAFPWVRAELESANDLRRRGLLDLATGDRPARESGYEALNRAQAKYEAVVTAADGLEEAFRALERAMVVLPAIAGSLGDRGRDPTDERLWNQDHAPADELQGLLTPPEQPGLPANLQSIRTLAGTLRTRLDELEARAGGAELDRQIGQLKQGKSAVALRRLLESPLYRASDRAKIYDAARALGQEWEPKALDAAKGLTPAAGLPSNSNTRSDDPAWRAKLAIDLLKLDGVTDTRPLEAKLAQAAEKKSAATWEDLGEQIRRAWAVELPKKFLAAKDAPTAARMGYIVSPFDEGSVRLEDSERVGPWLQSQERQFRTWLARERYQKDADLFAAAFARDPTRKELQEYAESLQDVATRLSR